MQRDSKYYSGVGSWLGLLLVPAITSLANNGSADSPRHRVLQKYPSPQDVAEQVRRLEADDPGVVQQVLADFDLSIRSSLTLKPPPVQRRGVPHVRPPEVTPGRTDFRASLERMLEAVRKDPGRFSLSEADQLAQVEFYEKHFDEFVVEDSPHLALVMMYVLAHGWQDWSAWEPKNEQLSKARAAYPELHRINALDVLEVLRHKPATGLLLRSLIAEDDPMGGRALYALRIIGDSRDVLEFYIDWAVDPITTDRQRWRLWTEIQAVTQSVAKDRAFWEPYLESDVPTLWYCAQQAFDRPLPEDRNWLSKAQSDWNYAHERDPKVRRRIELARQKAAIRARENPETGRISVEDLAEIQALEAEEKRLEGQER